jgi:hypothetical protein
MRGMSHTEAWKKTRFPVALALVACACTGSIDDGATEGSAADPGGPAAGGPGASGSASAPGTASTPAGAAPGSPAAAAACAPTGVLPAPLRRLTHAEYAATLADLFPGLGIARPTLIKDPAQDGFENRARLLNPSPLLVEQYSSTAIDVAIKAVAKPSTILPCTPTAATEAACGAQFVETFGARVFRRPLTADEKKAWTDYLNAERAAGDGFMGAVQLTIENMLQSPQFLYRIELGQPDAAVPQRAKLTPYEVASRMSYLIWGGPPDAALLAKAQASQLDMPADREKEARRLLADARSATMFVEFHRQWLDLDRIDREPKDPKTYPTYDEALKSAMREESDRLVASVMKGDGTLRSLFSSAKTEVNTSLAKFYGVAAPTTGWTPATLNATERAGFLTRPNFLAARAHMLQGSPPLRAIFIMERLLCQGLPPPPADADLSEPATKATTAKKTNRQLFEERIQPPVCNACHSVFQPLGYAFESYDAIGRYRTTDNGLPVDTHATFRSGAVDWQFTDALDLSQKLADSPMVQSCVARNWFAYAQGRDAETGDACRLQGLEATLTAAKGDVRELLVAMIKSNDFVYRPAVTP